MLGRFVAMLAVSSIFRAEILIVLGLLAIALGLYASIGVWACPVLIGIVAIIWALADLIFH